MIRAHPSRTIGLVLALALALGACGGGGGSPADDLDDYLPSGSGGVKPPPVNPPGTTPPPTNDDSPVALAFRYLEPGSESLITTAQNRVARDQLAWNTLWIEHYGVMPPGVGAPDVGPPIVDFTTEIVVGVFLGTRPTGGYTVDILAVMTEGADGARVTFQESQPGQNCLTTQAITQPFVFIAIRRVEGTVAFTRTVTVVDCP